MINNITTSTNCYVIEKDQTMSGVGANWNVILWKFLFFTLPYLSNEASLVESRHCSNKSGWKNGI